MGIGGIDGCAGFEGDSAIGCGYDIGTEIYSGVGLNF